MIIPFCGDLDENATIILTRAIFFGFLDRDTFGIFVALITNDDHGYFQTVMTLAPAFGSSLSGAHLGFDDRLS